MASVPGLGLIQVYTGPGKGKTSAACGAVLRAAGHGLRVCFMQFLKAPDEPSGELYILRELAPRVSVMRFEGQRAPFTAGSQEARAALEASTMEAVREASGILKEGDFDLVVLDELNVVVAAGLVQLERVLEMLGSRRPGTEVIVTGRGAAQGLIEKADLVTEMLEVKHPHHDGTVARQGIEL